MQFLSVIRPVQINTGIFGHLRYGNSLSICTQIDAGAGLGHRRHIDLKQMVEGYPLIIGTGNKVIAVFRSKMYSLVVAGTIDTFIGIVQIVAAKIENTLSVGAEPGIRTAFDNARALSA